VLDLISDPQLPFFIQWISPASEHPSRANSDVRISKIEIAGDAAVVADWLGEPSNHPLDDIDVEWIASDDDAGIVAITFETPHGSLRLD